MRGGGKEEGKRGEEKEGDKHMSCLITCLHHFFVFMFSSFFFIYCLCGSDLSPLD